MAKKLDADKANKVYDLLVKHGGATELDRKSFIHSHCKDKYECTEWRFCGKLGFGGKYRSTWNGVTCYSEDETPERVKLIAFLNEELKKL